MKPSADWTTPADIRNDVQRLWDRGTILAARLGGGAVFPYAPRFRRPDTRDLAERFDDVRKWIRALEQGSKGTQGHGYEIEWTDINHRQLGRNRVPARISVPTEADALRLVGKTQEAKRFSALADTMLTRFPALSDWLARHPMMVLENAADWDRIIAILAWFRDHPRAGLYLRQLDIPGVDSKFIETHRGLLSDLLDRVLPPEAVDPQFPPRLFEQRYGLATKPVLVRFRVLDPRLRISGLSDLTVPAEEFARLALPADRVFITENEINGLAFPEAPGAIVIFGLGYGLDRLAEADWLRTRRVCYWGDIDTHGFAILDRLRAVLPHVQSFLMDRATLLAHRPLWGHEHDAFVAPLQRLTEAENALFEELRTSLHGDRVRLEQERISFGWFTRTLDALTAG
jgi:hypothetical protein